MSPLAMLSIVAQTSVPTTGGAQPPPGPLQMVYQFVPYILLAVVFIMVMRGGRRKQDKQSRTMLDSMKKGDRVQTIGGIIGTVWEARETEVVLKVDETSNTKMRFTRKAIAHVFSEDAKDEPAK